MGVLPLVTDRHARFIHNEVPGILIPESIQKRMDSAGENSSLEGARIALELIEEARQDFQGIYFMPAFNRFDMIADIIDRVRNG